MSRRGHHLSSPGVAAKAHSLALLSEYTHTLDSLPLDLSRNFADLRELDAVLSSSMSALTSKITQLTTMIETGTAPKEDRLWLLAEIAEEATRLKLGGEDKIRVACHAADGLRGHRTHMKTLLEYIPDADFEVIVDQLDRKTVYPHVAPRSFLPTGTAGEGGRRPRRNPALSANTIVDASPNKRRRAARDDDEVVKTPRKDRTGDAARPRNGARAKKLERAASPTESLVSVASHLPPSAGPSNSRQNMSARVPSTASSNKRPRATHNNSDVHNSVNGPPARGDFFIAAPSSSTSHPSLPVPYVHGAPNGLHGANGTRVPNPMMEWAHGQLEGPGMPVVRPGPPVVLETVESVLGATAEVDGDADDMRTYCFCNRVSYGDMIACDDDSCEREWFHLPCIGLETPPEGTWYCDSCSAKRARRTGRGGKKRSGARSAARNTSA
ncbi:hypothetical protein B0H21DRAFT_690515 [Amylocystis lapponica]|nr:hypothetical protein B0H21DRAFT_690515 [Amylocystis lapponica]